MRQKTKNTIRMNIILFLVGLCTTWTSIDICGLWIGVLVGGLLSAWMCYHLGNAFDGKYKSEND